jgi:phospholipase C
LVKKIENTYGKTLKGVFFAVNPIKKLVLKTNCTVHKFINIQSIRIIGKNGYSEIKQFYKENIDCLNKGVTWADSDFKSSNHFYHYKEGRGLYGFSNSLIEGKKYYNNAESSYNKGDTQKAMFYLGAAAHLIQDTTVPQHVNNKLLSSHRSFELWIVSRLLSNYEFYEENEIIRYADYGEYIKHNAIFANETYEKFEEIEDKEKKYSKIAAIIIKEAQKTTAGLFIDFYEKTHK